MSINQLNCIEQNTEQPGQMIDLATLKTCPIITSHYYPLPKTDVKSNNLRVQSWNAHFLVVTTHVSPHCTDQKIGML